MKIVGDSLRQIFNEFGSNGYKLIDDLGLRFEYPNFLPKGTNSVTRSNVNITMGSKHHEVSYHAGSRSSGIKIRKYFSCYYHDEGF